MGLDANSESYHYLIAAHSRRADADGAPEASSDIQEGVPIDMDPFAVRFTHDRISNHFRNGMLLDDAIAQILSNRLSTAAFPPMELVWNGNLLYSLSNRRLYVHRV